MIVTDVSFTFLDSPSLYMPWMQLGVVFSENQKTNLFSLDNEYYDKSLQIQVIQNTK